MQVGRYVNGEAAVDEWFRELDAGRIQHYQPTYGAPADQPIGDEELHAYEPLDPAEFERISRIARECLDQPG